MRHLEDIIFVRGTTEGINLVAQSWGRQNLVAGDEIVITWLEHHANIVPWQQLTEVTGAKLCVVPVDDSGQVLLGEFQKLLNSRTKLVSFTHVSNALGTGDASSGNDCNGASRWCAGFTGWRPVCFAFTGGCTNP